MFIFSCYHFKQFQVQNVQNMKVLNTENNCTHKRACMRACVSTYWSYIYLVLQDQMQTCQPFLGQMSAHNIFKIP